MFGLGAGPDPRSMSCQDIIRGFEKNQLLASPEGGRSAKHRGQSQDRVDELQSYYDRCVEGRGTETQEQQQIEVQAAIDRLYEGPGATYNYGPGGPPRVAARPDRTTLWITLGVGGALAVAWFAMRRKS